MDRCENCNLCKFAMKQCLPKGSINPSIYFVGEAPGPEEDKLGIPFIGKAGTYLHEIIGALGLNENNCRFYNVVRCIPKDNENSSFRQPNQNEIDSCINNLIEDINNTKPKVIVTLGYTASKALIPELKGGITQNRGQVYYFNNYIVIPTYHPSYLIRQINNNKIRIEFKLDIKTAITACVSPSKIITKSQNIDNKSGTIICKTHDQFLDFCTSQIDNYSDISYDVETNAKEVHSQNHRVVGFSLASNKNTGCYIPFKCLDYEMEASDKKLIEDKLRSTLTSKNVIQYNCLHELPVTLNWLGVEMPKIDDVFVMVKLMMGNADRYKGSGGLKAQSVEHLGYNDWSEDLDLYFSYLLDYENNKDNMIVLLSKYYDDTSTIINLVEDVVFNVLPTLPKGETISYEYVPCNLISKYGSIDSSVLFELREFYHKWMSNESERLNIDLYQGYKYWMMHHYCGYILEKNGAYWNDNKACKIEDWCNKNMNKSLGHIISSPLSEPYLRDKLYPEFLKYLKDYHTQDMLGSDFTPKRLYKTSITISCNNDNGRKRLANMSLLPKKDKNGNDTNIYKLELGNFETLGKRFLFNNPDLFESWYKEYVKEYTDNEHTIDEYKHLINPNATSKEFRDFVSNLLLTPMIRYAKLYVNLTILIEDPNFDIDYYKDFYNNDINKIDNSPKFSYNFNISEFKEGHNNYIFKDTEDSRLLQLVHKLEVNSDMTPSERLDIFLKYINSNRSFHNKKVKGAINNATNFNLESLDSGTMNEIYDLYLMCHIDVEDSSTWNEQFEWLFNYKIFKKFSKLISTYINGKVGRNNVYLVDKESYSRGDYFTKRENLYNGRDIPPDKTLMMQQDFRVNNAETGRWQSGMHNLPASDAIKGIYTSRFKGGCIGMPDGSQMEVRTLAAECKDENLLKAFKDGVDIHRFFASKIYRVDYDKVESWQRGLAKNAVFGMIYGESEKAFADTYLKGDLAQAKQIYNDMFTGFPKIKEYVERAQDQFKKFAKVTTITQRYINMDNSRVDPNAMLRRAQNYPIQAAAEDLAGIIMYKLCEYINSNNMKSKIFCFIHDSIEIDFHPDEVFQLIDKINYLFNVFPLEEFGVPVACDVPLGPSMGQECEVTNMVHDDDYNEVSFTLDGYIDDIEEVASSWREVYKLVEVSKSDSEDKESYVPWSGIFLPKKAKISMYTGETRMKGKRNFHIIRK